MSTEWYVEIYERGWEIDDLHDSVGPMSKEDACTTRVELSENLNHGRFYILTVNKEKKNDK